MNTSKSILNSLDLLLEMIANDLKIRYRYTLFGFLWIIFNSLFQMLIIGMIFSVFIKMTNYYLFLFTGIIVWQFFSQSLSRSTTIFLNDRSLLQKARFSTYIMPISVVASNFVHLIAAIIMLVFYLIFSKSLLFPDIFLLIPVGLWLLILTTGISLLMSSFYVFHRDVIFIVNSLLLLGFYVTPILYPFSYIPKELHIFFAVNPLTSIFELFRLSLIGQASIPKEIIFVNLIISILIVSGGIYAYKKLHRNFVDRL